MHKFRVHTLSGETFGPYESANPYLEHRDAWGREPSKMDAAAVPRKLLAKCRRYDKEMICAKIYKTVEVSPDYYIEIIKEEKKSWNHSLLRLQ
jgi:hypothetical protein